MKTNTKWPLHIPVLKCSMTENDRLGKFEQSITGHRKPRTTKVFFNFFPQEKGRRGGGGGMRDYRPPVNSSEFLVFHCRRRRRHTFPKLTDHTTSQTR